LTPLNKLKSRERNTINPFKMKQHITKKQWHELDRKAKGRWNDWCHEHGHKVASFGPANVFNNSPFIGQMIEFLDESEEGDWRDAYEGNAKDLCDALWQATKEVLKK